MLLAILTYKDVIQYKDVIISNAEKPIKNLKRPSEIITLKATLDKVMVSQKSQNKRVRKMADKKII